MQCKVCKHDNPPEASFCGNCGAAMTATAEPDAMTTIPTPPIMASGLTAKYIGLRIRFLAAIIDIVLIGIVGFIFSLVVVGRIFLQPVFSLFLLWLYYWLFTGLKGQTLGKMLVGIKVVNSQGEKPGFGVAALREILGKFVSSIVFCLGHLWIAIDAEKRGWHDRIASSHVVEVESSK